MPEIVESEICLDHLLWWTRGSHWDCEIVNVPKKFKSSNWPNVISQLLPEQSRMGQIINSCGLIHAVNGFSYFLAGSFASSMQSDWTNRPIPHYIVYFLPNCRNEEDFRNALALFPPNWLLDLESKYLKEFYASELFLLPEDEIREWRNAKNIPLQTYVQEQWSGRVIVDTELR